MGNVLDSTSLPRGSHLNNAKAFSQASRILQVLTVPFLLKSPNFQVSMEISGSLLDKNLWIPVKIKTNYILPMCNGPEQTFPPQNMGQEKSKEEKEMDKMKIKIQEEGVKVHSSMSNTQGVWHHLSPSALEQPTSVLPRTHIFSLLSWIHSFTTNLLNRHPILVSLIPFWSLLHTSNFMNSLLRGFL